jgi:glycosyltransferase involved in cell wall biosynthesis
MNVLMLSDVYFPRINGVSTSIETFRRDLAEQNVDVTLIAPHYPQPHDTATVRRIPSRQVPFDPEDRLMHWKPLMGSLREAGRGDVDLIHIQTPFVAHYAGMRARAMFGVPVVATYHTHFEEYIHHYLPVLPRSLLRRAARALARSQCNELDAVIVPSAAMRDTLDGYGVNAPMHILPTGIPINQFAGGDGAEFRRQHGIAEDRPMALFVGRVAHEKNIGFLLEATKIVAVRLPKFLLMIAGEGPALASLKSQADSLGIAKNVLFVGYLDRSRALPDCYAAANVFVFSSKTETQGLVLLEAMAAGIPVYAIAAMGTCDIVGPQQGSIAAAWEKTEFADGLTSLLENPQQLADMSLQARRFAASWSAPRRAFELASLYKSLIN